MDKFFIQAAFTSLDDIDKEENKEIKRALLESREKEYLKRCAGNPEKNTAAFNHATTIGGSSPASGLGESLDEDELWDSYVGKQVIIKPTNEEYHDQVGEISGLVDSGNSFDESTWEIYLSNGTRLELPGTELSLNDSLQSEAADVKLDESVAGDLKELDRIQKELMSQLSESKSLSEDVHSSKNKFNLRDEEDVKAAKEKLNKKEDSKEKEFVVVHPLNVHKDAKSGDAILQCENCKETYYIDKDELVSEQGELEPDKVYNIDYQCEHCGSNDGYVYVGDLATQDSEEAQEIANSKENEVENVSDNSTLEPVEDTEEPEEIVEESFDKLINSYGRKIYENLEAYKTTGIRQDNRNEYIIEGIITLNNGKTHNTSFLLETLKKGKNRFLFKCGNKDLFESGSPFRFNAYTKNKKLIFETLRYRYVENLNDKNYLVEGFERNK